jgi:hypothetical protein
LEWCTRVAIVDVFSMRLNRILAFALGYRHTTRLPKAWCAESQQD